MTPDPQLRDPSLRDAARRELGVPLAALRASLESLSAALTDDAEGATLLARALGELERADRSADALTDLALPRQLQPLSCSVREIALDALRRLCDAEAARVRLEEDATNGRLVVDGPALSAVLARLLQETLSHSTGAVLLHAYREDDGAFFSIVEPSADASTRQPGLDSLVAERDLARMGARLAAHTSANGHQVLVVQLDAEPQS